MAKNVAIVAALIASVSCMNVSKGRLKADFSFGEVIGPYLPGVSIEVEFTNQNEASMTGEVRNAEDTEEAIDEPPHDPAAEQGEAL